MSMAAGAQAIVLLAVLGAACDAVPTTPERRAREYVELLVQQPDDAAGRLEELDGPTPVLEGVATGVALGYLRARVRQGPTPEVSATSAHKSAPGERLVIVAVSPGPGRAAAEDRVRFQVRVARDPGQEWRVRGVRVE
jgi:hypothetical protein